MVVPQESQQRSEMPDLHLCVVEWITVADHPVAQIAVMDIEIDPASLQAVLSAFAEGVLELARERDIL